MVFLKVVFSLCKEKSPRLLRNEVSDNVPEYSGPFFVVLINTVCFSKLLQSFIGAFRRNFPESPLCCFSICQSVFLVLLMFLKVCLPPSASSGPESLDNVVLKDTCSLSAYKYPPLPPGGSQQAGMTPAVKNMFCSSGLACWLRPSREPVKVLHIVYGGSLCCRCRVSERVSSSGAAAADGADGAADIMFWISGWMFGLQIITADRFSSRLRSQVGTERAAGR